MDLSSLGRKIKEERKRQGLTLEVLSERAGISRNFLWEIEAGRKAPALDTLYRLGVALDISIDYLMGVADERRRLTQGTASGTREREIARILRSLDGCGSRELSLVARMVDDLVEYMEARPGKGRGA